MAEKAYEHKCSALASTSGLRALEMTAANYRKQGKQFKSIAVLDERLGPMPKPTLYYYYVTTTT